MIRQPAVAGSFYPGEKVRLSAVLEDLVVADTVIPGVVAAVAPHAGYQYSGAAAGALFASIEVPETVVILGPNHRGLGQPYGLFAKGSWRTPLGDAEVDEALAAAIAAEAPFVREDTESHLGEHSIEVMVPFLQYRRPGVRIVPICVGEHEYGRLVALGRGIAAAIKKEKRPALVLASSDMTHYESAEEAGRKDRLAIERMLALDEEGLWQTVGRHRISMCGVAPAVAAMAAARDLGAEEGKLIQYSTSGDVTGDMNEVVGYASVVFMKGRE